MKYILDGQVHTKFTLMIDIFKTFSFVNICPFFYPFIRHPLVSIKNWASTVYHMHVRSTTSFHIMPKNSRASYRCHCDTQSRKCCIATFWHLRGEISRISVSKLGLKKHLCSILKRKFNVLQRDKS